MELVLKGDAVSSRRCWLVLLGDAVSSCRCWPVLGMLSSEVCIPQHSWLSPGSYNQSVCLLCHDISWDLARGGIDNMLHSGFSTKSIILSILLSSTSLHCMLPIVKRHFSEQSWAQPSYMGINTSREQRDISIL